VISDYDFHATKRRAFEVELRRALDEYFRSHAVLRYPEAAESEDGYQSAEEGRTSNAAETGIKPSEKLTEMDEDILRIVESTFR
jgi:hypothetical protein